MPWMSADKAAAYKASMASKLAAMKGTGGGWKTSYGTMYKKNASAKNRRNSPWGGGSSAAKGGAFGSYKTYNPAPKGYAKGGLVKAKGKEMRGSPVAIRHARSA